MTCPRMNNDELRVLTLDRLFSCLRFTAGRIDKCVLYLIPSKDPFLCLQAFLQSVLECNSLKF